MMHYVCILCILVTMVAIITIISSFITILIPPSLSAGIKTTIIVSLFFLVNECVWNNFALLVNRNSNTCNC